ncbi:MAG: hypothetical protein P1U86_02815 [Verrucomicrobiales bacterium]|nr:hypothetical protein [Verrucomicrobiales bacterium]
MENKILSRSEEDSVTTVDCYVEPHRDEDEVRWYFYPRLPEGMHWKAGDAMGGLGFMHDDSRQSFSDFKRKPAREVSDAIKNQVVEAMEIE